MKQEYGYSLQRIKHMLLGVPILIGFIVWRYGAFGIVDGIVLTSIIGYSFVMATSAMCKVTILDSEIDISFLSPFRKGGTFAFDQIDTYAPLVMERKNQQFALGGMLSPKEEKHIMLLSAGINNFDELSTFLSETFPKPETEH